MCLGVLYSGKQLESPTAKHCRYRLEERVLYGGVEPAEVFGERLFLAGEACLGLSHARHLLLRSWMGRALQQFTQNS